jgi:hypothetical protein
LRAAARYAVTGNHLPNPANPSQFLTRVASIEQVAQRYAMGIDVSGLTISSRSGGAGMPGDTVTLSLTHQLVLMTPIIRQFFPNGAYTITVSTSFKNEPFPPSQRN